MTEVAIHGLRVLVRIVAVLAYSAAIVSPRVAWIAVRCEVRLLLCMLGGVAATTE